MSNNDNQFLRHTGVQLPLICGAMYPCSNPELVAAVSEAGALGIIQPLSMVYVHGHEFRRGMELIRSLTQKPVGMNILVEKSAKAYENRMRAWLDVAIDMGVRFFVTALGNPTWVIERVRPVGGIVYHDVTERKWAVKARDYGVDGLICVNGRAGGHAGRLSPQELFGQLTDLGLPLVCAGGIGSPHEFKDALAMGYAAVQMGTRFIATAECRAHADYKQAIVNASEQDIVLTDKISGVPVSVIKTPYVARVGTKAGPLARWLLRGKKTKHWMRLYYALRAVRSLKHASLKGSNYKDYFQAGKSVATIDSIKSAAIVVKEFAAVVRTQN